MAEDTKLTYHFEWDPVKARSNLAEHNVSFGLAGTVFRDPLATTIFDEEHSEEEERWVTLGQAENGQYLVVVHTYNQTNPAEATTDNLCADSNPAGDRELSGQSPLGS